MQVSSAATGIVHFIGIGGIGMSSVAEILHSQGYAVRGSDASQNANVQRLREKSIKVFSEHKAENIADAAVVVISTAIPENNPELVAARSKKIPVLHRAEMLAEIMRNCKSVAVSGTHGKTSTTSMLGHILTESGKEPTVINGGVVNAWGSNARFGVGEWMIVEADESDGSFVKLPATHVIVTNIDAEHLSHYGSFDALKKEFSRFTGQIPFYGIAVICHDNPGSLALAKNTIDRRVVTYGESPDADVRAVDIAIDENGSSFRVEFSNASSCEWNSHQRVVIPQIGKHYVLNALAVVTMATELGETQESITRSLASFQGVARRFSVVGRIHGITFIDDYAHHPVEISCTMAAAKVAAKNGRVIAVLQPHRYSRLKELFDDFCHCLKDADHVILMPVYSAGEEPIPGITVESLANGIERTGQKNITTISDNSELSSAIRSIAEDGDYVVCLGAGSISTLAKELPSLMDVSKNVDGSRIIIK
jgi:UDP-N-acetylmuramate--alanine ligase